MTTFPGLRAAWAERSALSRRPSRRGTPITPGLGFLLAIAGLLLLVASPALAQEGDVAGTVVAARSLRPLEGVELRVVGTDFRTRTDAAGRFVLRNLTGPEVTLELRWLGYRPLTKTVPVGERAIRLALVEVAVELDAIVVTGTPGGTEARAIGNAVGTIAAADVLEVAPVVETQQLLNARVPGVIMLSAQGNVGTGALTQVRGISSPYLTNEPLLYVDGVRVDNNARAGPNIRNGRQVARINDFNPEDIDRVEVIKGPAAATIYGTEASRGVIQMFTREGREGPPRFGVTFKQGGNWFMNPAGRLNWVYGRDSTGALDSLNLYQQEQAAGRPMFQTGPVRTYGLNVSGGAEAVRYYLSGSFDGDEGILSYNWRQRISTRANLSLLPSDKLDIRTSLGFVHNTARLGQAITEYGLMEQIDWGHPATRNTPLRGFLRATPEAVATIDSRFGIDRFTGSLRLRHQPTSWLTQRLTTGVDLGDETSSTLFPRAPDGTDCFFAERCLGDKTVDRRLVRYGTFDYGVSAAARLAAPLRAITSVGTQYYTKDITTSQVLCQGFPNPGVTACSGATETSGSEDRLQNKTVGVYAQQQLGWNNRLFLTGALRADDNSAFGANFDFVVYPKAAATWVVSEEPFWRVPWVNALKLRAAWGRAGQQPDAFAAESTYLPVPGGTVTPQNVGNPDLKPERGEEVELGLDVGLWRDRIGVTYTYFQRRTRDAIVPRPVTPSLGFPGTQLVNLGAVRNSGAELALDARVVDHHALAWDLGFTISTNNSGIESLGGLPPIVVGRTGAQLQEHREGYPLGGFFNRVIVHAERDASGQPVNILCDGGAENDGRAVPCDSAPRVYNGQPTPRWQGSVRATVTIRRNLRLYGLVDFKGGYLVNSGTLNASLSSNGAGANARALYDSSDVILLAYERETQRGVPFLRGVGFMNGGFAKLREVSATYTLPDAWAARVGASRGTITVAGRNLAILWMAERTVFGRKVVDPEQHFGDADPELSSFVRAVLPQYAQGVMTVRLTF